MIAIFQKWVKAIPVGDYIWILKKNNQKKFVLNYIVERKNAINLISSIEDGRYKDQKYR